MRTINTLLFESLGHSPANVSFCRRLAHAATSIFGALAYRIELRRSRIALLEMTDDQLKDIGISRADAYREGMRPIWN